MKKRDECPHCQYIKLRCLCHLIRPIHNNTELVILMHPTEKKHALNTVKIMKLFFTKINVLYGENFSDDRYLNSIIKDTNNRIALIFKSNNDSDLEKQDVLNFTHLIFLDGTWNKAKKIYYSSPVLHPLNTFSLSANFSSDYKIRKSNIPNGLSTLEAATYSLSLIEPNLDTSPAIKAFKFLIDFQIEKIGTEKFTQHYKK